MGRSAVYSRVTCEFRWAAKSAGCYTHPANDCAGRASNADFMLQSTVSSVETRASWLVASMILVVMAIAFGAPWITVVALKDIAAEVDGDARFQPLPAR